jgi:hypothetical protein
MKVYFTILAVGLGLAGWLPAQAEVIERQFSENNLLVKVTDDSWQPDYFENGKPIPAVLVGQARITIDGRDNESQWALAREVRVPLKFGNVKEASIKALYTEQEVFIRVRWPDSTMDRDHHPWVWNAEQQQYVAGPQVEDSLLLSFEAGCEWNPSILAGYQFDFDGWHWLAARSDPVGQARDLIVNLSEADRGGPGSIYQSRYSESSWILKFDNLAEPDGLDLQNWDKLDRRYLHWPIVETLSYHPELDKLKLADASELIPAPASAPVDTTEVFPQFRAVKLEGDAGEVAAKGHWEDGYWTVEFRRNRLTPSRTMTDTVFNRLTQFSVHVFDHTERIDESSESKRLFLQFLPVDTALVNN